MYRTAISLDTESKEMVEKMRGEGWTLSGFVRDAIKNEWKKRQAKKRNLTA